MKKGHNQYLAWFRDQTSQGIEPTPELAFLAALDLAELTYRQYCQINPCADVISECDLDIEHRSMYTSGPVVENFERNKIVRDPSNE